MFTDYISILFLVSYNSGKERILNGDQCPRESNSHMVSLKHEGKHFCGGTLLSDKFVLTAAHCFEESEEETVRVYHGESYSHLEKVYIHPKYASSPYFYNDIAILQLKGRIEPSTYKLRFVNLPKRGCAKDIREVCSKVDAMGWGIYSSKKKSSDYLRCAQLPTLSKDNCKLELLYTGMYVTEVGLIVCTLDEKQNICSGDSGGPIFCEGKQVGIASYGHIWACTKGKKSPAVYTKVDCYVKFIYRTIENAGGHDVIASAGINIDELEDVEHPSRATIVTASHDLVILFVIIIILFRFISNIL